MKLYVDMDGVLVDFEGGVRKHFGNSEKCSDFIKNMGSGEFWKRVSSIENFWEDLEPIGDVENIWKSLNNRFQHISILSSPSYSDPNCIPGKNRWIDKHIGQQGLRLFDNEKHKYACPKSILIDDSQKNISKWEESGGIGILFTGKFDDEFWTTLKQKINLIKSRSI
jgi:hypothetical protein